MQIAAHSMARVVLHHRKTVGLDVVLDRSSDVEECVARLDLGQALHQRFLGHPAEGLGLLGGAFTYAKADAAVAVIAVEVGTGVDLHQIAGLNNPFAVRDAVDHFVVDRCTDAGRETVIPLEAGGSTHLADALFGMAIEVTGAHSGSRQLQNFAQHRGHDPAGLAHGVDLAGRLDFNAAPSLLDAWTGFNGGGGDRRALGAGQ